MTVPKPPRKFGVKTSGMPAALPAQKTTGPPRKFGRGSTASGSTAAEGEAAVHPDWREASKAVSVALRGVAKHSYPRTVAAVLDMVDAVLVDVPAATRDALRKHAEELVAKLPAPKEPADDKPAQPEPADDDT